MNMTKPQIREALGIETDTELATFFDTSKQAIYGWGDDKPIPEGRQWQARAKRPDVIPAPIPARSAA